MTQHVHGVIINVSIHGQDMPYTITNNITLMSSNEFIDIITLDTIRDHFSDMYIRSNLMNKIALVYQVDMPMDPLGLEWAIKQWELFHVMTSLSLVIPHFEGGKHEIYVNIGNGRVEMGGYRHAPGWKSGPSSKPTMITNDILAYIGKIVSCFDSVSEWINKEHQYRTPLQYSLLRQYWAMQEPTWDGRLTTLCTAAEILIKPRGGGYTTGIPLALSWMLHPNDPESRKMTLLTLKDAMIIRNKVVHGERDMRKDLMPRKPGWEKALQCFEYGLKKVYQIILLSDVLRQVFSDRDEQLEFIDGIIIGDTSVTQFFDTELPVDLF